MKPSWDETFINIVDIISKGGTCDRGMSGCVITKNNRILSTGYVGAPSSLPHCNEVGHDLYQEVRKGVITEHCERTVHAEMNAIATAAKEGISLLNTTLYCTMIPCYSCAKMILSCGIKKVICKYDYQTGEKSRELFHETGIKLKVMNNRRIKY